MMNKTSCNVSEYELKTKNAMEAPKRLFTTIRLTGYVCITIVLADRSTKNIKP